MRRPSFRWSQQSTDGSRSPLSSPVNTPSSSFPGSSYFTSRAAKRANKASEDSPSYSSPLTSFWKQSSPKSTPDSEESPKTKASGGTPQYAADLKSPKQDVQDWNITRLFDPKPSDSTTKEPKQGPSCSTTDWNVTRSHDVKPSVPAQFIDPPRAAREGYEWVWFPAGYWAERELPDILSPQSNPEGHRNSKPFLFSRSTERQSNGSEDSTSPRGTRRFWGSFSSRVARQYTAQSFKGSFTSSANSSSKSERFLNSLQSFSPTLRGDASPPSEVEELCSKKTRGLTSKRFLTVPFSKKKNGVCHHKIFHRLDLLTELRYRRLK